jgi:prephenate dehydratase
MVIGGKRYDNIVFIASYVDLAKKAQKVIKDLEIEMEIVHSKSIQHGVEFVNESLKTKNIDAIITRGGN